MHGNKVSPSENYIDTVPLVWAMARHMLSSTSNLNTQQWDIKEETGVLGKERRQYECANGNLVLHNCAIDNECFLGLEINQSNLSTHSTLSYDNR